MGRAGRGDTEDCVRSAAQTESTECDTYDENLTTPSERRMNPAAGKGVLISVGGKCLFESISKPTALIKLKTINKEWFGVGEQKNVSYYGERPDKTDVLIFDLLHGRWSLEVVSKL